MLTTTSSKSRCGLASLSDQQLIERSVCAGALAAVSPLDELFKRHYDKVKRYCLIHIGNQSDADDIAQEVALKVLKGLRGYEGRASFETWLRSIAKHECVNYMRKRQRHRLDAETEQLLSIHAGQTTADTLEWDRAEHMIEAMRRQLSVDANQVIEMRFFGDLSVKEVAASLMINVSAAKMRLHRALDQLRRSVS